MTYPLQQTNIIKINSSKTLIMQPMIIPFLMSPVVASLGSFFFVGTRNIELPMNFSRLYVQ
jgi:hypothetical protein